MPAALRSLLAEPVQILCDLNRHVNRALLVERLAYG
jgi:hypothetical protein